MPESLQPIRWIPAPEPVAVSPEAGGLLVEACRDAARLKGLVPDDGWTVELAGIFDRLERAVAVAEGRAQPGPLPVY